MTTSRGPSASAGSTPLADALGKNKEAAEEVKRAVDDLAVVHAVLDTQVAQGTRDGDLERAVAETGKVEKRLEQSADKLDQVNETLEREVQRSGGQ